jgi:hypothetical protein
MTRGKIIQCVGGDRDTFIIILEVKVKGSLYRPEAQAEVEVSSNFWLTSALYAVGGQHHAPATFPREMAVWTDAENLAPTGIRSRTVQTVVSRYTNCAVPVHIIQKVVLFK